MRHQRIAGFLALSLAFAMACNAVLGIDDPRFPPSSDASPSGEAGPSTPLLDGASVAKNMAEQCTGTFDCNGTVVTLLAENGECVFSVPPNIVTMRADGFFLGELADGAPAVAGTWTAGDPSAFVWERPNTPAIRCARVPPPPDGGAPACGSVVSESSPGFGVRKYQVALGALTASKRKVSFSWDMGRIKDRIKVTYSGNPALDTGCAAGGGSSTIDLGGFDEATIDVEVNATCEGSRPGVWAFTVGCPAAP